MTHDDDQRDSQFPPCSIAGCDGRSAYPGVRIIDSDKPICCVCAVKLYRVCTACGAPFDPSRLGFDVYALDGFEAKDIDRGDLDHRPLCEDCWLSVASCGRLPDAR